MPGQELHKDNIETVHVYEIRPIRTRTASCITSTPGYRGTEKHRLKLLSRLGNGARVVEIPIFLGPSAHGTSKPSMSDPG